MTMLIDPSIAVTDLAKPLAVGVHSGIPSEFYHAQDGASNSRLCEMMETSPAHARHKMLFPEEPTPAMIIGDATHILTLQGDDEFDRKYVISGTCDAVKKDGVKCKNPGKWMVGDQWKCGVHIKAERHGKAFHSVGDRLRSEGCRLIKTSKFGSLYFERRDGGGLVRVADHAPSAYGLARIIREGTESIRVDLPPFGEDDGRRVLSKEDYDLCRRMRDAVMSHKAASSIILAAGADTERSVVWDCPDTGMRCKGRIDAPAQRLSTLADLKTTVYGGGSRTAAMQTILKRGYIYQADMYLGAMAAHGEAYEHFVDIFVEKEGAHAVSVFRIEDDVLEKAHEVHVKRMKLWKQCVESGDWPSYADAVQSIRISDYAMRGLEQL